MKTEDRGRRYQKMELVVATMPEGRKIVRLVMMRGSEHPGSWWVRPFSKSSLRWGGNLASIAPEDILGRLADVGTPAELRAIDRWETAEAVDREARLAGFGRLRRRVSRGGV